MLVPLYMDIDMTCRARLLRRSRQRTARRGCAIGSRGSVLDLLVEPESGAVFCLAEAPSIEAVEQVHREAHGQLADDIIEVEPGPVQAFFGSLPEHPVGEPYTASAVELCCSPTSVVRRR